MSRSSNGRTIAGFAIGATACFGCQVLLDVDPDTRITVIEVEAGASADGSGALDALSSAQDRPDERPGIADGNTTDSNGIANDGETVVPDATDEAPPFQSPSPNAVACFTSCTTPEEKCCWTSGGTAACINRVDACNGSPGFQLLCDDAGDCGSGHQCCLDGNARSLACSASATCLDDSLYQACLTDAECAPATTCTQWPCALGPDIRTCGLGGFNLALCY